MLKDKDIREPLFDFLEEQQCKLIPHRWMQPERAS